MEQLHVTQFSGEELQKRFDKLENQLKVIQNNFEPKTPIEFLTRQQTADLLQVDLSSIWNYTRKNILQSYGISGRVYYKRKEVEKAIVKLKK